MVKNVEYSLTDSTLDRKVGIFVTDHESNANAVVAPFLSDISYAEILVKRLNEIQLPVPDFCDAVLFGNLDSFL